MKEKPAADRRVNALMRKRTLEALEESGVTRYGICRALHLNKGNVYAYLAGDDSKVSRETARRIMEYAEERSLDYRLHPNTSHIHPHMYG